jgi:Flp pilus assembly protein CpaB
MRKLNITLIAGVVLALAGAILVFSYGHSVDSKIAAGRQMVPVLVATQDIPSNTKPAALGSMTTTQQVPTAYVQAHALRSLAQAPTSGVLLGPVVKGAQLSSTMFGNPSTTQAVTPPKGKVDVAISVGLTPGMLHYVSAGSEVDMFVTYGSSTSGPVGAAPAGTAASPACGVKGGGGSCTKLFATGVRVVSVTQASATQTSGAAGSTTTTPAATDGGNVLAVLEVTPDLAEKIVNAVNGGSIYLALTGSGDPHTTTGTNQADVIGSNQ